MTPKIITLVKFLILVVALNIIRYALGMPIEKLLIFDRLFAAMEQGAACFKTEFTTFDWATSYFYNFMMWLTVTWIYLTVEPHLAGHPVVKSLKVFGWGLLFFLSLSAIYMNHYRHPRDFYFWNMLDGVLVFPLVGIANGLIYPVLFKKPRASTESGTRQA